MCHNILSLKLIRQGLCLQFDHIDSLSKAESVCRALLSSSHCAAKTVKFRNKKTNLRQLFRVLKNKHHWKCVHMCLHIYLACIWKTPEILWKLISNWPHRVTAHLSDYTEILTGYLPWRCIEKLVYIANFYKTFFRLLSPYVLFTICLRFFSLVTISKRDSPVLVANMVRFQPH